MLILISVFSEVSTGVNNSSFIWFNKCLVCLLLDENRGCVLSHTSVHIVSASEQNHLWKRYFTIHFPDKDFNLDFSVEVRRCLALLTSQKVKWKKLTIKCKKKNIQIERINNEAIWKLFAVFLLVLADTTNVKKYKIKWIMRLTFLPVKRFAVCTDMSRLKWHQNGLQKLLLRLRPLQPLACI